MHHWQNDCLRFHLPHKFIMIILKINISQPNQYVSSPSGLLLKCIFPVQGQLEFPNFVLINFFEKGLSFLLIWWHPKIKASWLGIKFMHKLCHAKIRLNMFKASIIAYYPHSWDFRLVESCAMGINTSMKLIGSCQVHYRFLGAKCELAVYCQGVSINYNHGHNIMRIFEVLPNFPFTRSERKPDY